jgi:hypothetical protein
MAKRLFFVFLFFFLFLPLESRGLKLIPEDDQISVELTLYSENIAVVKDVRSVTLDPGDEAIRFMGVSSKIMPETVKVLSLNHPNAFKVLEQFFEYDPINSQTLLKRFVGKEIELVEWNKFQDKKEVIKAELLAIDKEPIYRINGKIYIGYYGYKVLPEIPEDLVKKPSLTLVYKNNADMCHELQVCYLTRNLGWKADYVLVLKKKNSHCDLSCWATIENKTGTSYKNAKIKLVAGKLHRVRYRKDLPYEMRALSRAEIAEMPQPLAEKKPFFEYHLYDLKRTITLLADQKKQISLFDATGIKLKKEYIVYGGERYYITDFRERKRREPVGVYISFKNNKINNLGIPLPAGVVHIYKEDEEGGLQFIGEDRLRHTPKNEEVTLKVGEAFDIVAERVQKDYQFISSKIRESEWEIKLKNHKEKTVKVAVVERLTGNWKILKSSHPYKKLDAFRIRFEVKLPPKEDVEIEYKVRVIW